MYTNGNLESHIAALLLLGSAGLVCVLLFIAAVLFFARREWARYPLVGSALVVAGYALVLAAFSGLSRERTLRLGEEKHFCELDCHIAYSVQDLGRAKSIEDVTARGEFYMIRLRTRFDQTTIAPWRPRDAPLTPVPVSSVVVDGRGGVYEVSGAGQAAWNKMHGGQTSEYTPLVPGQSYDRTLVFDVPIGVVSPRLLLSAKAGPSVVLIGDEESLGHKKTYLAMQRVAAD